MASSNPSHLVSEGGSSVAVDSGDPRRMSYTRSGRRYKGSFEMSESGQADGSGASAPTDLQQVLQLLMEDRRQREEEIAAERRQREEETERRLREMQQHVDSLLRVVEKTTSGLGLGAGGSHESEAKVSKLTEADDIEAYLTTFERLMGAFSVPKERWVFKLAPQLTGKAQQAYAALDLTQTTDYDQVKSAILKRYNVTEETYRTRLRAVTRGKQESYAEMATRVVDLTRKWTRRCAADADAVREAIAVEQLLNSMPAAVRVWVAERKPQTVAEAGKLADDHMEARGSVEGSKQPNPQEGPRGAGPRQCYACGKPGHIARDCLQQGAGDAQAKGEPGTSNTGQGGREQVRCFRCHQKGHFANKCPTQQVFFSYKVSAGHKGPARAGAVEETPVEGIVLDTGAAKTMIHRDLVPVDKVSSETVNIQCAHGDIVSYPMAEVSMRVGNHPFTVKAAVSDRLPVPVLVGREVPEFDKLLGATLCGGSTEAAKVVANPSQRRQEKLSGREREDHERELGATEAVLGPETSPWRDEPLGLTEPIVARRLSARQQERIRRDTVVSQEKGGGV